MEPTTVAAAAAPAAAATVTAAAATKVAQKAIEELFGLAKGRVAFWWKEQQNKKEVAKKLGERIRRIDKIKTLLHTDKEVQLSSIYYPSRVIYDGNPARRINSIEELPSSPSQNYIIEGTVGQGKSVFLRYLCLRQLKGFDNRIPLFLELRLIDPKKSFQQFLIEGFAALGLHADDEFFDFYAKSGRFVLLLDAFDEVPQDATTSTVTAIENLTSRYPQLQILVTSRPHSPLHPSTSFNIIKLEPLVPTEHLKFLETLLGDPARAKRIARDIQNSPNQVKQLLSTPLLMTLLAVIYNADQAVPQNEAEFYRRLFDVLLYRHDKTKLGFERRRYTNLGEQDIRQLFEAFCFFTRQARLGVLTIDQFCECLTKAKENTGFSDVDHFKYKDEIVKVACLLQEEGFSLHFIHKSVQEFYASAFILNSPEKVAIKFYDAMAGTKWQTWKQEIRFLEITDTYRFNRYFYRQQMQSLFQQLKVIPSGDFTLTISPQTADIAIRRLDGQLLRSKTSKDRKMTAAELKHWRPLRSIRVRHTILSSGSTPVEGVDWFGVEALYTAELLEKSFLFLIFDWVNQSEDKSKLEDAISGMRPSVGPDNEEETYLPMERIFDVLGLKQTFEDKFTASLHDFAQAWKDREERVRIFENRVDII